MLSVLLQIGLGILLASLVLSKLRIFEKLQTHTTKLAGLKKMIGNGIDLKSEKAKARAKDALLWLLIIGGLLIVTLNIAMPFDHPTAFWLGVVVLLVMAAFYAKWDKVFPGHTGKKTVHALMVAFVVSAAATIYIPKELWVRYTGVYPMDWFTVKESEKAAAQAQAAIDAHDDKILAEEAKRIAAKVGKGLTPAERAFQRFVVQRSGDLGDEQKVMPLEKGVKTVVSKEGFDVNWMALDPDACIKQGVGGEAGIWHCPIGVPSPDGSRAVTEGREQPGPSAIWVKTEVDGQFIVVGYTKTRSVRK